MQRKFNWVQSLNWSLDAEALLIFWFIISAIFAIIGLIWSLVAFLIGIGANAAYGWMMVVMAVSTLILMVLFTWSTCQRIEDGGYGWTSAETVFMGFATVLLALTKLTAIFVLTAVGAASGWFLLTPTVYIVLVSWAFGFLPRCRRKSTSSRLEDIKQRTEEL